VALARKNCRAAINGPLSGITSRHMISNSVLSCFGMFVCVVNPARIRHVG